MQSSHSNEEISTSGEDISQVISYLKDTYSDTLGLKILEMKPGFCKAVLPVRKDFLNPIGSIHGGLLYTAADTAAGIAASRVETDDTVTTISGTMQFMRPCIGLSNIYLEGSVIKSGKRIVFTETKIMSEDHTLYAKADFQFARIKISQTASVSPDSKEISNGSSV